MNEKNFTENDITVIVNDRVATTATIGYMCIAITLWMTGMLMAGWYNTETMVFGHSIMFTLGSALLVIIGILTMIFGRGLDAIVFLSMSGLFFSLHEGLLTAIAGQGAIPAYYGWYAICWAIFFFYVWISAIGMNSVRMLFLLGFWLAALADAIGGWSGGSRGFSIVSGYLLLITAILAFVVSASSVIAYRPGKVFQGKTITTAQSVPRI